MLRQFCTATVVLTLSTGALAQPSDPVAGETQPSADPDNPSDGADNPPDDESTPRAQEVDEAASSAEVPVSTTDDDKPDAPATSTMAERSGFFFQGGLGLAFPSLEDDYSGDFDGTESVSGILPSFELLLGGTVVPSLIVGGGLGSSSGEVEYRDDYGEGVTEVDVDGSVLVVHGFVQKYFSNFFVRGSLGALYASAEDAEDDYGGFSWGLAGGFDFASDSPWSLGVTAGIRNAGGSYDEGDYSGDWSLWMPTLRVQGTYY